MVPLAGESLLKKTQSHVVTVSISMLLVESQGTTNGKEVAKHAGEHAAIITVELAGSIVTAGHQFPFSASVRHWLPFLIFVFCTYVTPNLIQILVSSPACTVMILNTFFLHKNNNANPVLVVLVDGEEDLVESENIPPCMYNGQSVSARNCRARARIEFDSILTQSRTYRGLSWTRSERSCNKRCRAWLCFCGSHCGVCS